MTAWPLLNTALNLAIAFGLGTGIGLERQFRQRTAGLRTNVLVAIGAAAFVDLGTRVAGAEGASRVIAYVVSGIGFLGAGVIMKEGVQVRGLNTAATLWATAAVGAFVGAGYAAEASLVAVTILACNTWLRPLADAVNRRPILPGETEALYRVHGVCRPEQVSAARDVMIEELKRHSYPLRGFETLSETDDLVELAAILVPTTADPGELDAVVACLEHDPSILSATWTVSTLT